MHRTNRRRVKREQRERIEILSALRFAAKTGGALSDFVSWFQSDQFGQGIMRWRVQVPRESE